MISEPGVALPLTGPSSSLCGPLEAKEEARFHQGLARGQRPGSFAHLFLALHTKPMTSRGGFESQLSHLFTLGHQWELLNLSVPEFPPLEGSSCNPTSWGQL